MTLFGKFDTMQSIKKYRFNRRKMQSATGVSQATLDRLPAYLRYLQAERGKGVKDISSSVIAEAMQLSAVAVRKDLSLVSSRPGKPRIGFSLETLISDIESFLGYRKRTNVVIMGAGNLGRAILRYEGFEQYGLSVIAAFDVSAEKIGSVWGKPIYPVNRFDEIVRRENVKIGILSVPQSAAQEACDRMIEAGIRAVYNLAPVHLDVPEGVHIKYEDLATSLAALCNELTASE